MPYFEITKRAGMIRLGTVEADDPQQALDVLANRQGFWDFNDLAASLEVSPEKAEKALWVREAAGPTYDGPDPKPVPEPTYV